jgi:hypothetical protein
MADSMSQDESRRYTQALWFAVHEKDLRFETADLFADWWAGSGWMFHREIRDGFVKWQAGTFPRPIDDEES